MKFIIVLQLLLSTTLFAQVSHIYSFGREWVVVNESVFERGAKAFYPIPDLPRISTGADLGLVSRAFDGDYGYLTEQVGNKGSSLFQVGKGVRAPSGDPQRGASPSNRSLPAMR